MPGSKTSKYIVTELKAPESKRRINAEYSKYATRILWLDDTVVAGAFHMNTAWYVKATATTLEDRPHVHDTDEIIGFFGNNAADPGRNATLPTCPHAGRPAYLPFHHRCGSPVRQD